VADDDGWSGIRVYLGDPRAAWSGESTCGPCNRFCADLRTYNRTLKAAGGKGWRVGYSEEGADLQPNRIVLVRAMVEDATPYFVPVFRGVEDRSKRIEGYGGDFPGNVEKILAIDPLGTVPARAATPAATYSTRRSTPLAATLSDDDPRPATYGLVQQPDGTYAAKTVTIYRDRVVEKPVYIERTRTVYVEKPKPPPPVIIATRTQVPIIQGGPGYSPHWTWPGSLKEHLVAHGYSRAYLDGLTVDQMERLHDADHDSGRVTSYGAQRWPAAYGAAPRPAAAAPVRAYARSSGVQVLGAPIVGTYRQGWSACPGGRCP
jgi:hypothetical protein